jgi:hypothetical protein
MHTLIFILQVTLVIHEGCVPANLRFYENSQDGKRITITILMLNWRQNSLMLTKLTKLTKPGGRSTQVRGFKIWPRIEY